MVSSRIVYSVRIGPPQPFTSFANPRKPKITEASKSQLKPGRGYEPIWRGIMKQLTEKLISLSTQRSVKHEEN
jgi:hypothetical protein